MKPIDWFKGLSSAPKIGRSPSRRPARRRRKSWQSPANWEALEGRIVLSAPAGDNRFFGAIAAPGQVDTFQFTLASPTNVWFDNLPSASDLTWSLSGPQGVVTTPAYFYMEDRSLGLLPAGAYTVTVAGVGETTGSFAFRMLEMSVASTAITPGTSV
ncbi:hypothetical protein ACYOEI_30830, partial [Singulisphaera rosea]